MSKTRKNSPVNHDGAPSVLPGDGLSADSLPQNVMGMITDLLAQQQQWQQRQSESEQLIARMAEQLESSRRSIENLTGTLNGGSASVISGAQMPTTSTDPEPASGLSWEKQKQQLMAGYDGGSLPPVHDGPVAAAAGQPDCSDRTPRVAGNDPDAGAAPTEPASFLMVQENELAALGDCDQSKMLRKLRRKLEDKLRDAEIEISIERARIHRARRDLEQQRMEFEREVTRVRDEMTIGNNKKNGNSRWARFLGDQSDA